MNFLLLGDMGSKGTSQNLVAKSMETLIKANNIKFICGLGDNIYEHGVKSVDDNKFKTHFEKPYKNIKLKFYMCLGNHDYGEISPIEPLSDSFQHQIDYTKVSNKWVLPKRYYTFKKKYEGKTIEFFVLDTNIDVMDQQTINKQIKFMKKKIKKSNADWKILYGHHTYRSTAGHGNAEPEFEDFFNKFFDLGEIDIYMCGHDHTKQYIQKKHKGKILHLIVCGTGGKDYNYEIYLQNMNDCDLYFSSMNLGVGLIFCKDKSLTMQFFNEKNQMEYQYSITK